MTKDEIKIISLTLFTNYGYEGTTLSEIAKRVGIQKPSIYNHFKNKDDIFLCLFEEILEEHIYQIKKLVEEINTLSSEEKLKYILLDTCNYYKNHEEKATFLKRAMIFPPEHLKHILNEKFLRSEKSFSSILRTIFIEGIEKKEIREGKIENLIMSYFCLIDGVFMEFSYYGKEKMEPRIQNIWENFWFGLNR
ncbi:TetR/AcrR family transcriptional regulator [Priestia sp. SIMBA_032]|uniref:TetR/AcrR family transcriptional regulator n=1 Tax=Priestia sp. SIMBA_032 TaxID=3085775 RepID=UPI00397DF47D